MSPLCRFPYLNAVYRTYQRGTLPVSSPFTVNATVLTGCVLGEGQLTAPILAP